MKKNVIKLSFPSAQALLSVLLLKSLSKIKGHLGAIEICNNQREEYNP